MKKGYKYHALSKKDTIKGLEEIQDFIKSKIFL